VRHIIFGAVVAAMTCAWPRTAGAQDWNSAGLPQSVLDAPRTNAPAAPKRISDGN